MVFKAYTKFAVTAHVPHMVYCWWESHDKHCHVQR